MMIVYITTQEFNKLMGINFAVRIAQEKLAMNLTGYQKMLN